jgi:MFS family permease
LIFSKRWADTLFETLTQDGAALAPFRVRVFRAIWIAMMFSNFGSLIQSVGAAWLMTTITPSHQLVALVSASVTIPIMLLALFAGAIADSFDRRKIMLVAQTGMFAVSSLLSFFTWQGDITPAMLLALTFLVGVGTTLNGPAWQASLRMQVPAQDLPAAISLNSISFNLARSVGPALGGLLISIAGPALNFAVNALSYLGIIAVLWRWQPSEVKLRREPLFEAIGRGLRFCRGSDAVRNTLIRSSLFGACAAGLSSLMPLVARELIGGDQISYGILLGSFGIGSIFAALLVGRVRGRFGNDNAVVVGSYAYCIATIGLAWSTSLVPAVPLAFIGGMGWVLALTSLNIVIQLSAPVDIVGRCISIYHMCTFGAMALGAWGWGALSDATSLRLSLCLAGGVMAATPLLRWLVPVPDVEAPVPATE